MKCLIPGRYVKLFGRSIHCLSKIGDELYLEALKDGLTLRTVSSSRSAYACFLFGRAFFAEYDQGVGDTVTSSEQDQLKLKLTMKSCMAIFKSLATIEKVVDSCLIELKSNECRFVFMMYCKHGVTKTHNVTYQECESLQATFSKELCPNQFTALPRLMLESVLNFNCDEISLEVCPEQFRIRNYVDSEPDPSKVVHTEMTLAPEEFENYQVGVDTQVTFCLKEFRAILSFSEFVNQPVRVSFETGGKPIVFSLDGDETFSADFVMATLSEQNDSQMASQSTSCNASQHHQNDIHRTERTEVSSQVSRSNKNNVDVPLDERQSLHHAEINGNHDQFQDLTGRKDSAANEEFFGASFPYQEMLVEPKSIHGSALNRTANVNAESKILSTQQTSDNSGSLMKAVEMPTVGDNVSVTDEVLDILVSTPPPPAKKFKSSFFAGPPPSENKVKENCVLLAEDTDEDE